MKTCPSCRRAYEDDSLVFCLDDGARLERERGAFDSNATLNLPPPGPTVTSPRPATPTAQSTLTSRPEQFQSPGGHGNGRDESRRGALPWVFAIVLVLAASGVLIAWLMTRSGDPKVSGQYPVQTPLPSIVASPTPDARPEITESPTPEKKPSATPYRPVPTPTTERPKAMFTTLNNTSLNGTRITYYQRASFALCKADCGGNANCKGLAWIRPGAYNPSDPGMCYLLSAVTQRVTHECCIAAVKN